jgi:ribosomal protein L20
MKEIQEVRQLVIARINALNRQIGVNEASLLSKVNKEMQDVLLKTKLYEQNQVLSWIDAAINRMLLP